MNLVLEKGVNPTLRKGNFKKIYNLGKSMVSDFFGLTHLTHIDSLTLRNGRILTNLTLQEELAVDRSRLLLQTPSDVVAVFQIYPYAIANKLPGVCILIVRMDTYMGEGSGIGTALFELGEIFALKHSSVFKLKEEFQEIYLVGEDISHKRNSHLPIHWTSKIMSNHGYSNNRKLRERLGKDFETGDIMAGTLKINQLV